MSDWKDRAQIQDDVVFFRYVTPGIERSVEEVYIWDLDKTYLDTSIDGIAAILNTAMERAFLKRNVPGTNTLLEGMAETYKYRYGQGRLPLYFISASPPQMEMRIAEKFTLDSIRPYGCFYKDNLRNLVPSRFWRLKKHVGYKLQALLQLRLKLKEEVRQICWGDDSESDAIIYNLYSDLCARRIGSQEVRSVLKFLSVSNEQIDTILHLQSQVPDQDPVEKIYINLAVDTDPDYYLKFGRRTLPTYNTFQVTLDLWQDQRIPIEAVEKVARDLLDNYNFTAEDLMRSFDDLVRRKVLGEAAVTLAQTEFPARKLFPADFSTSIQPAKEKTVEKGKVFELEGHFEPWVQTRIDYLHEDR